jgi:2',3'-cyclic-nucleotide 2'-phosphodiesterase (5'-nucleotidase family)
MCKSRNIYLISLLIISSFLTIYSLESNDDLIDISSGYTHINPKDKSYVYIAILSTNDLHGHFFPEDIEFSENAYTRGGMDYLEKYIDIIRNEFKSRFIYLDAGDLFKGGLESQLTDGDIMTESLNLMQCKATTFGLHEFDYSREFLENKIKQASFPYLSTNIYDNVKKTKKAFGDNHLTSKIYTINISDSEYVQNIPEEEKNDDQNIIKIGIVGLAKNLDKNDITGTGFDDIDFLSYKNELTEEATKLREEGCHAVLLLANIGLDCGDNTMKLNMYKSNSKQDLCDTDSELYQLLLSIDSSIIDGIITGQSHKEVHHWINDKPIISSVDKGLYANILYLQFKWDKTKEIYKVNPKQSAIEGPIPICEKIFNKTNNCELIKQSEGQEYFPTLEYQFHGIKMEKTDTFSPIHNKYDSTWEYYKVKICDIVGTEEILNIENNGDFYIGNILTEIQNRMTGSQISIFDAKLLSDTWNPGKLPKYKISSLITTQSKLCSFSMKGKELLKMMSILQSGEDKYYATSGLKQIMSKDENNQFYLSQVKYFDGYKEEEIIPDKDYTISAIEELIVNGKGDFKNVLSWYKPQELKCDYGSIQELIEIYLKAQKTVDVRKYKDENNPKIKFIL